MTNEPELSAVPDVCPFLGLADDRDSHATFATEAHRCYKLEEPTRIAPNHQDTYCLNENYERCPVYRGQGIPQRSRRRAPAPAPVVPPAAADDAEEAGAEEAAVAGERRGASRPGRRTEPFGRGDRSGRAAPSIRQPQRAQAGGLSMPIATVALFVLAVAIVAAAIFILNQGDDDDQLPADDTTATATETVGENETPAGDATDTATGAAGGDQTPGEGTATETPEEGETPTGGGGGTTYEVQPGDFCAAIAQNNGVTVEDIIEANGLDANCSIFPGQELTIPAP